MIVAGTVDEAVRESGDWVFVDLGFSSKSRSCCMAVGDADPFHLTYGELGPRLERLTTGGAGPVNLLVEAPLSVAFSKEGNPTGRRIERRRRIETGQAETRFWYVGPGAAVLIAATYLLRRLHDANPVNEVRLFEGFASFKSKRTRTSHANPVNEVRLFEGFASFKSKRTRTSHVEDVMALRDVASPAWGRGNRGRVVGLDDLKAKSGDVLRSTFVVEGMHLGIPAVVLMGAHHSSRRRRDRDTHPSG